MRPGAGEGPDAPIPFGHEQLTGGDQLLLTPLVIAAGTGGADSVMMLMSSGARLDTPGSRFARRVAERLGHEDTAPLKGSVEQLVA